MRIVCVFRDNQDYSRDVFEWIDNFKKRTGKDIEIIDPDQNVGFCEAYDVVEYPTILALGEKGEIVSIWKGRKLPLFDEVAYYTS